MTTRFTTLLTIDVTHSYYAGVCEDIGFVIPSDVSRQLRKGRLLTRQMDGAFHVLFEAGDDGTPVAPLAGQTVRVGLKLLNPYFTNFTLVDPDFNSALSLYRNSPPATALNLVVPKPDLVAPIFSHLLSNSGKPTTVVLKNLSGSIVQTDKIIAPNFPPTTFYDLTGKPAGLYTVEETPDGGITKKSSYYVDSELLAEHVYGVLEITLDASYYTQAAAFALSFAARQETLNYYIVGNNYTDNDLTALSITDGGPAPIQFNPIILSDTAPYANTAGIPADLLGGGGANVGLIQSKTKVMRREAARTKLQLIFKKNGGTETLVANLPQPGPDKAGANLIIPLSK